MKREWKRLRILGILGISSVLTMTCGAAGATLNPAPPLRGVYFVTRDRQPCSNYEQRLDRVMREVQRFYAQGMKQAGFGDKTFGLETNAQGFLRLHRVRAREESAFYGREASDKVRREVGESLKREGIDIDRETIVIFQTLLQWTGDRAVEVGPYVGGGSHLSGTAWVYDDDRLDSELLSSKAPGGYYGQPCSLGEFNSHYIGGVAHELGHALGLPHVCETQAQRASRGTALMGGGNHTYGSNLRGEGAGTFLHPVSAMRLAHIRVFTGDLPQAADRPSCRLREMNARFEDGKLFLEGRLESDIAMSGVGAYDDWTRIPDDYDAIGWLGELRSDGHFRIVVETLRRGQSQMRLTVAHVNGATTTFPVDYVVDAAGQPELGVFRTCMLAAELNDLFRRQDLEQLAARIRELEKIDPPIPDLVLRSRHLMELLKPQAPQSLADIPSTQNKASLSLLRLDVEEVGWGRPFRDRVLDEGDRPIWLQVGNQFYARGFYAHAPARHVAQLTPGWKTFHAGYGLQDGADGSVLFVVRGDGRELFRSSEIRDHQPRQVEVKLDGVSTLELVVENAGDGNAQDWGVWLEPELRR